MKIPRCSPRLSRTGATLLVVLLAVAAAIGERASEAGMELPTHLQTGRGQRIRIHPFTYDDGRFWNPLEAHGRAEPTDGTRIGQEMSIVPDSGNSDILSRDEGSIFFFMHKYHQDVVQAGKSLGLSVDVVLVPTRMIRYKHGISVRKSFLEIGGRPVSLGAFKRSCDKYGIEEALRRHSVSNFEKWLPTFHKLTTRQRAVEEKREIELMHANTREQFDARLKGFEDAFRAGIQAATQSTAAVSESFQEVKASIAIDLVAKSRALSSAESREQMYANVESELNELRALTDRLVQARAASGKKGLFARDPYKEQASNRRSIEVSRQKLAVLSESLRAEGDFLRQAHSWATETNARLDRLMQVFVELADVYRASPDGNSDLGNYLTLRAKSLANQREAVETFMTGAEVSIGVNRQWEDATNQGVSAAETAQLAQATLALPAAKSPPSSLLLQASP